MNSASMRSFCAIVRTTLHYFASCSFLQFPVPGVLPCLSRSPGSNELWGRGSTAGSGNSVMQ
eukprot:7676248-Alexandrium_andersonii.AAC.1